MPESDTDTGTHDVLGISVPASRKRPAEQHQYTHDQQTHRAFPLQIVNTFFIGLKLQVNPIAGISLSIGAITLSEHGDPCICLNFCGKRAIHAEGTMGGATTSGQELELEIDFGWTVQMEHLSHNPALIIIR